MQITTIGLDIAKNAFQVHGIDAAEKVVVRKQLRRSRVLEFFKALPARSCISGRGRDRNYRLAQSLQADRRLSDRSDGGRPQARSGGPPRPQGWHHQQPALIWWSAGCPSETGHPATRHAASMSCATQPGRGRWSGLREANSHQSRRTATRPHPYFHNPSNRFPATLV